MTRRTEPLCTVLPVRSGSCSNLGLRLCREVAFRWALTFLVAASFTRPTQGASPSPEDGDRLLAQIEPRIKAIYETTEFAMRSFRAIWLPDSSGYLKLETPAGASAAAATGRFC